MSRLRKRLTFLRGTAAGLIVLSATIALWAIQIESRAYPKYSRTLAQQLAGLREDPAWQIKEWLGLNPPPAPVTAWETGRTEWCP